MEKDIPIKINKEAYEKLKKLKDRDGVPMAESLRRAVFEYTKKQGVK